MRSLLAFLRAVFHPRPDADALAAAGGTQPRSDFALWEHELTTPAGSNR